MPVSREQFIEHLTRSGLLSAAEVSAFQAALPPDRRGADAETLARELVKAGRLTRYQAQVVYQGKIKGLVFGEYTVLNKLGQGGMGLVLKAEHRRMKRLVAVKVISAKNLKAPQAVERFYREVQAAARLTHPNIVAAYDAGEHEEMHYLVMELVEGQDLAALIRQRGPLPVEQAVECVIQAARGLQYAHDHGIIHRDIKPGNLLIDKQGTIKILDMGLARMEGSGVGGQGSEQEPLTAAGQVLGTCDYMAPEQAFDPQHVDRRADIYALGCTLYRLLTGAAVYQTDTLMKTLVAHREAAVPSLCAARPDAPPALNAVFRKMVAKRPEDRYGSMNEVIAALEGCIGPRAGAAEALAEASSSHLRLDARSQFDPAGQAANHGQTLAANPTPATAATFISGPSPAPRRRLPFILAGGAVGGVLALAIVLAALMLTGKSGERKAESGGATASSVNPGAATGQPSSPPLPPGEGRGEGKPEKTSSADAQPPALADPPGVQAARQLQQACARDHNLPLEQTNSIGMKFILIPPGEFDMGSTPEEIAWALEEGKKDKQSQSYIDHVLAEAPRHRVTITKPFSMGAYPVTQGEYERVMGLNPSSFAGTPTDLAKLVHPLDEANKQRRAEDGKRVQGQDTRRHPVELVSWEDAMEFCRRLSALPAERAAHRAYRLPSEAQWEYACRAGTTTRWFSGDIEADLPTHAWLLKNSEGTTHPVGQLLPNAWGLYDMLGNVVQWCMDWHGHDYYKQSPAIDPLGPPSGSARVVRGGSFNARASLSRSAYRINQSPAYRYHTVGFRVCQVVAQEPPAGAAPTSAPSPASPHPGPLPEGEGDRRRRPIPASAVSTPANPQSPIPNPSPKLPVPDAAALAAATKQAADLFKADYDKAATPAARAAVAQRVLQQADQTKDDAAGRYALLRAAQAMASQAGDLRLAFEVADRTATAFDVDAGALKADILAGQIKTARTTAQHKPLLDLTMKTADEALDAGNFDAADALLKLAALELPRFRSKELTGQIRDRRARLDDAVKSFAQLNTAQATLAKDPRDAAASTIVGRYLCFAKGDWASGLPLLANGNDEPLRALAGQELGEQGGKQKAESGPPSGPPLPPGEGRGEGNPGSAPRTASSNPQSPIPNPLPLADGWWDVAQPLHAAQRDAVLQHAALWYRRAVRELPAGIAKTKAEKRLSELGKLLAKLPAPPPAIAPFDAKTARQHQQAWANYLGLPVEQTNSIGMKFVLIPPGEFDMGSSPEEIAWAEERGTKDKEAAAYFYFVSSEAPRHHVRIGKPFYLGAFHVTQGEYARVMGVNPSSYTSKQLDASAFEPPLPEWVAKIRGSNAAKVAGQGSSRRPVETVTWDNAVEFCQRLAALPAERAARRRYGLPSEAQWEYACRAGTTGRWWCGDDQAGLLECAWILGSADGATHPVGGKRPNPWALYDMHGNVWQWCNDWFDPKYYERSPALDPAGPTAPPAGVSRAARGGDCGHGPTNCPSAFRGCYGPGGRDQYHGFRVVQIVAE